MSINSSEPDFVPKPAHAVPDLPERKGPMRASDRRDEHFRKVAKLRATQGRAWQAAARKLFED